MAQAPRTSGGAVERSLAILGRLAQQGPTGFTAIARHLGVAHTVAARLLKVLTAGGWVEPDPIGYRLGPCARQLLQIRTGLADQARPVLDSLRDLTGCTCLLVVEEWGPQTPYLRCVAKASLETSLGMQEVGAIRTTYLGHPWAWIFLGEHDEPTRRHLMALQQPTEQIPQLMALYEVAQADLTAQGCCRMPWNHTTRYAVPVRDPAGRLLATIGLGVPDQDVPAQQHAFLTNSLRNAAQALQHSS